MLYLYQFKKPFHAFELLLLYQGLFFKTHKSSILTSAFNKIIPVSKALSWMEYNNGTAETALSCAHQC